MKKNLSGVHCFLFLLLSPLFSFSQTAADTWSVKFSTGIRVRYNPTINTLTSKGWEYSNGIITHGIEKVFNNVPDSVAYRNYIQTYVDAYVNASGVISTSIISLDKAHPAISCLFLYEKLGTAKYQTAAATTRNIFVGGSSSYPKTAIGNIFWHKNNGSYNDIILIDGVYMLHPFLAKYGSMFGDNAAIDTAVNQTLFIYNQLYDPARHLIRHAWNPTKTQSWADPVTGNSAEVWSRGMGWFTMAVVDILKYVPIAHPKRAQLITALQNLAIGIQTYQDATTGLWYQVVDRGTSLSGNYLETSGSAMFVYSLKTGVDNGWLSNSYLPVAQKAWDFLKNTANSKITIHTDTYPKINDFAPAMSVQTSAANYASLASVDVPGTTHPHGYAAILMAASVMELPLLSTLPVKFVSLSAKQFPDHTALSWENEDDTQVNFYQIEKSINGNPFNNAGKVISNQSGKYAWRDNELTGKSVAYRIKAVLANGSFEYSNIISVKKEVAGVINMSVTPNPVRNRAVNVSLNGLKPGHYKLTILHNNGLQIFEKNISVANEYVSTEQINLSHTAAGNYFILITGNGVKLAKNLIVY